jgi:hypothetical protein
MKNEFEASMWLYGPNKSIAFDEDQNIATRTMGRIHSHGSLEKIGGWSCFKLRTEGLFDARDLAMKGVAIPGGNMILGTWRAEADNKGPFVMWKTDRDLPPALDQDLELDSDLSIEEFPHFE